MTRPCHAYVCTTYDTHATLAVRAGVAPKVIAERLGHHTPEFTMRQYAHVLPGMQAEAAARIADLVAGVEQRDGNAER